MEKINEYANMANIKRTELLTVTREKVQKFSESVKKLEKKDDFYSNIRLFTFFAAFALFLVTLKYSGFIWPLLCGVFAIAFVVALGFHDGVLKELAVSRAELTLLNERIMRVESPSHKMAGVKSALCDEPYGHAYLKGDQGYENIRHYEVPDYMAIDLDLFKGTQNLFGIFNTAQTSPGQRRFYNYLKRPSFDCDQIKARQSAVSELSEKKEFIDEAMKFLFPLRGKRFSEYLEGALSPQTLPSGNIFINVIRIFAALPVILLILGKYEIFAFFYVMNFLIMGVFFERCARIKKNYAPFGLFCGCFADLSWMFEKNNFNSRILREIQSSFLGIAKAAPEAGPENNKTGFSDYLNKISSAAGWLAIPIPALLDALILFDMRNCVNVEKLVNDKRAVFEKIVGALAEFEAILCFAGALIEKPEYKMPCINDCKDKSAVLKLNNMSHPFIAFENAIPNSISFGENFSLAIITGSNMSGKSTFLKSLAMNLILACAGGPVKCESAVVTPLKLITDIRISDSITSGVSHFYSELLRAKNVTDALSGPEPVFGIFDELFHGTNSRERIALCRATIEYLQKRKGFFIIATHDRDLTDLAKPVDARAETNVIKNFHFEERIKGLENIFTYKLLEGPSEVTNAILLARKCGLPAEIYERASALAEPGK